MLTSSVMALALAAALQPASTVAPSGTASEAQVAPAAPAAAAQTPHIDVQPVEADAPAPVQDAANPAGPAEDAPQAQAPLDDSPPPSMVLRDPWEKPNRSIWDFDIFFERHLLGPVAHGYSAVTPQPVRDHISNVILNLDEPITTLNALLQLHIGRALKSGLRFVINSTVGVAGLFDVAGQSGLPARRADFGQTLARWGAKPGPYVVIPFLGPSNVRDGFGRLVDNLTDPMGFVIGSILTPPGAGRFAAEGINWRQANDSTMKTIYGAQDPYAFTRSAYAQQRAALVQDSTGKAADLPDF